MKGVGEKVSGGVPEIICGEVRSVSPLCVRVSQKLTIVSSQIVVPSHLAGGCFKAAIDGETCEVELPSQIDAGDRVFLIGEAGGERYYLLGRI